MEQKFVEEVKQKYEEEKNDDELNKLYKDRIRNNMIEKIDHRPAGEILGETFVSDEKIN